MNLRALIAQGEHENQDFKFEISDARKIAVSLVAFSNTSGGRLLVGVKDNGRIAGVRSDEEIHMLEMAAGMYCRPKVDPEFILEEIDGKTVLVCNIKAEPDQPRQAEHIRGEWRYFVRIKDENIAINKVIAQSRLPRNTAEHSWSDQEIEWVKMLSETPSFSRSKFQRLTGLHPGKADRFLADLIRWDLVGWRSNKGTIEYYIASDD